MSNSDGENIKLSELSEYVKIVKLPDDQNESQSEIPKQTSDSNQSDSDNFEHDSEQPLAKKAKLRYDTQSSESSQNVKDKKKERQRRYREQNREKLKQREVERRKRKQNLKTNPETKINRIESISEESLSGLEGTQTSSVQENEQAEEKNALQKRRERQQRYREQNSEKLKQREAERRKRQRNSEIISEAVIYDEICTNSLSVAGLEETQNLFIEITERVKNKSVLRKDRDRRYRDRHQEKINQRRRDNRQSRQSFHYIASSSNGHSSSSSVQNDEVSRRQVDREIQKKERDRKYRERHREEINQRRRERREKRLYLLSLQPNCTNVDSRNEVSNRQMEKNALRKERDRKYRERHREEINQRRRENRHRKQNAEHCATESSVYSIGKIELNTTHENLKELGNEHQIHVTAELENYISMSTEPNIPVCGDYATPRTQLMAPRNPALPPLMPIRKEKKQDAERSSHKQEDILTQAPSEILYDSEIPDIICMKQENVNVEIENEFYGNKYVVPHDNGHQIISGTKNKEESNVTVNVKVENEMNDQFATMEEEYYPYELAVTNLDLQIKQEPFEKDKEVIS